MTIHERENSRALALAQLFSTCVECMLLIHPSKEWERDQRLLMAKLGIQQGRLIAWGDMLGICELGDSRDSRLDEPETRKTIEQALQNIIDRPAHTDRATQFEKYGLKPARKSTTSSQPALDVARLEAFRAKLESLQEQRWEVRRGMSITVSHWMIADAERFKTYLNLIRKQVDSLIGLVGIEERVNRAIKYDIKALGWHPVFEKSRAAADMSKLRLIKEVCTVDYPEYAVATQSALEYLDKEWKDSYQEAMERRTYGSEIPGAAAYITAQSSLSKDAYKPQTPKRPGLFHKLKSGSWRRASKDLGFVQSTDDSAARTMSLDESSSPLSPPLMPERSKSIAAVPSSSEITEERAYFSESIGDQLTLIDTMKSTTGQSTVGPVTSMISRHDQWRDRF